MLTCLENVLEIQVPRDPRCVLLHCSDKLDGNRYRRALLWLGLVVAKRDIARAWKAINSPSVEVWRQGLDHCMSLERPVYIARRCPNKFYKIWTTWADYRNIRLDPFPPQRWREELLYGDCASTVPRGDGAGE